MHRIKGHYLHRDQAIPRSFKNLGELSCHNRRAPYAMVKHCFINKHAIPQPIVLLQKLLTAQSYFYPLLMYLGTYLRRHGFDNRARIFLGLQQCRNVVHRIIRDRGRILLQTYIRVQFKIIVLGPPALLSRLSGKKHKFG